MRRTRLLAVIALPFLFAAMPLLSVFYLTTQVDSPELDAVVTVTEVPPPDPEAEAMKAARTKTESQSDCSYLSNPHIDS